MSLNQTVKNAIKEMLTFKLPYAEISRITGLSKSTISYYAKTFDLQRQPKRCFDWDSINKDIKDGHNKAYVIKKYNIHYFTLMNAIDDGNIVPSANFCRTKPTLCSSKIFLENSKHSRSSAKRRIIEDKLITYECEQCGQEPLWNGKTLTLVLDHRNGIKNDHRIENLRFLCPNCNSQTDTFAGRNVCWSKHKRAKKGEPQ